MKRKQRAKVAPHDVDLACDCGGHLRPQLLAEYDFSGYVGFPLKLLNVPGLRCTKCAAETVHGGVINLVFKVLVSVIAQSPGRLNAEQARFLRRVVGTTQQELSDRMGIARETVAKWECGDAIISPQHDLILRVIVLGPLLEREPDFIPRKQVEELFSKLQAVRTAPPSAIDRLDLAPYELKRHGTAWKVGAASSVGRVAAAG